MAAALGRDLGGSSPGEGHQYTLELLTSPLGHSLSHAVLELLGGFGGHFETHFGWDYRRRLVEAPGVVAVVAFTAPPPEGGDWVTGRAGQMVAHCCIMYATSAPLPAHQLLRILPCMSSTTRPYPISG